MRHPRIAYRNFAQLEHGPIFDARGANLGPAGADLRELCLELSVARMLRLETCKRLRDRRCSCELRQHRRRIRRLQVVKDIRVDAGKMDAANLCMSSIGQERVCESELSLCQRLGIAGLELRRLIVGGLKPVGVDGSEKSNRRF